MAIPRRNSDPRAWHGIERTFFTTSKTVNGKHLLQSDRLAALFIEVLRSYVDQGKFTIHDFVVMPDHVHLLLSIDQMMTIEKAMQLIKGGFSYRAKKQVGYPSELWQRGFSELRITSRSSFLKHREYIYNNPREGRISEQPRGVSLQFGLLQEEEKSSRGLKPMILVVSLRHDSKSCPDTVRG